QELPPAQQPADAPHRGSVQRPTENVPPQRSVQIPGGSPLAGLTSIPHVLALGRSALSAMVMPEQHTQSLVTGGGREQGVGSGRSGHRPGKKPPPGLIPHPVPASPATTSPTAAPQGGNRTAST